MTIDEIKELIRIFTESGVAELEVQRGENRVRIKSRPVRQDFVVPGLAQPSMAPAQPSAAAHPPALAVAPSGTATSAASQSAIVDETHELVRSPIVGTYYDAPAPGAPPFVKVGDQVEPGQVLCIIESMKLMNEIEAEIAGAVVAKLVENGHPVEYGEALFAIRPR
jgi:acetyl-CoA carboxylase biotin carboxyl carrier protein